MAAPVPHSSTAQYYSKPKPELDQLAAWNGILWSDYMNADGSSAQAHIIAEKAEMEDFEEAAAKEERDAARVEGQENLTAVAAEMKSVHLKAVHPNHREHSHAANCTHGEGYEHDLELEKVEQNWPQGTDESDGILRWETALNAQGAAGHMMELHPGLIHKTRRRDSCINERCRRLNSELLLREAAKTEMAGVPHTVSESQKKSAFAPEASAVPNVVQEKEQMEWELLAEVPKARATSEGFSSTNHSAGATLPLAGSLMMAEDDQEYLGEKGESQLEEDSVARDYSGSGWIQEQSVEGLQQQEPQSRCQKEDNKDVEGVEIDDSIEKCEKCGKINEQIYCSLRGCVCEESPKNETDPAESIRMVNRGAWL